MRKSFWLLILSGCLLGCTDHKQKKDALQTVIDKNPIEPIDQSPMDMAYYPAGYPLMKMKGADTVPLIARVIYSRPHKKGRKIFGESAEHLCAYGRPWRLGANESTELELFRRVKIGDQTVEAGRYIMYCIPNKEKWTVVLNRNLYSWGLDIQPEMDEARIDVPVQPLTPELEDFTMVFIAAEHGADLLMAWDDTKALLPIQPIN